MRTPSRSFRRVLLPVLIAFLMLSCGLSTVGKPVKETQQAGPSLTLPNPAVGLDSQKNYRVAFQQDVVGTLDGNSFEKHTSLNLTRLGTQLEYLRQIHGTQENSYFHTIQTDQAVYRWQSSDSACDGQAGALRENEIIEPASLLLTVLQADKVGSEVVNGIAATHYRFNQDGLALSKPAPAVNGEYWIADQGGFIVRYILEGDAPTNPTGTGMEVAITYTYELTLEGLTTIALPITCPAVPLDLPVMPDSAHVLRTSGSVSYQTASNAAQVVDLYFQHLSERGWTSESPQPTGDVKVPLGLGFSKGEWNLSMNIEEYQSGILDVDIRIYNPNAPRTVPSPAITPAVVEQSTPADPQPTIDPVQTGLPSDIPLFPGSTALQKYGDQVVMFTAPSAAEPVAAWYQEQMKAQGWSLLMESQNDEQRIQTWQKSSVIANISAQPEADVTQVIITWTSQ